MFEWLRRCWRNSNSSKPEEAEENGSEYRRGEFVMRGKEAKERLEKHDEQAKQMYDSIETSIDKLRQIKTDLKKRKIKCNCLEPEDA